MLSTAQAGQVAPCNRPTDRKNYDATNMYGSAASRLLATEITYHTAPYSSLQAAGAEFSAIWTAIRVSLP